MKRKNRIANMKKYNIGYLFALIVSAVCTAILFTGCNKDAESDADEMSFEEEYIDCFRRIGVRAGEEPYEFGSHVNTTASEMGLDYTDKSMTIMHLYLFDDEYIYDEYLKVYLYLYSKTMPDNEMISTDDLLKEYELQSNEIMEGKLIVFLQKGGQELTYKYLIEISKAYSEFEKQTGEAFNEKELRYLELDDCIELEEWAFTNLNKEDYPIIFQINA